MGPYLTKFSIALRAPRTPPPLRTTLRATNNCFDCIFHQQQHQQQQLITTTNYKNSGSAVIDSRRHSVTHTHKKKLVKIQSKKMMVTSRKAVTKHQASINSTLHLLPLTVLLLKYACVSILVLFIEIIWNIYKFNTTSTVVDCSSSEVCMCKYIGIIH